MQKNKFAILIFAIPEVHNTINSFSLSNFIIVNKSASKKLNGINFVKIFDRLRKEYRKYVEVE